jgi:hypothetical protein
VVEVEALVGLIVMDLVDLLQLLQKILLVSVHYHIQVQLQQLL